MIWRKGNLSRRLLWSLPALLCGVALLWVAHASSLFSHDRADSRDLAAPAAPPAALTTGDGEQPSGPPVNDRTWAISLANRPLASDRDVESLTESAMPELVRPAQSAPAAERTPRQEPRQPLVKAGETAPQAAPVVLPVYRGHRRSPPLEQLAEEADRRSRRGFELAGRGAYFAARTEFVGALGVVAQGLDAEYQTPFHSQSLSAGLTALREADDFLPGNLRVATELSVGDAVRSHLTPVLKGTNMAKLASAEALKCYFTYAQEQLAATAASEVAGSMALLGMGKVYAALAAQNSTSLRGAESKAVVCFQASLLVFPQNYLSSNDLGVLLGRGGHYAEARIALEHSVSVGRQAAGWHNLAVIYQQLGYAGRAARADMLSAAAGRAQQMGYPGARAVDWLDSRAFAESFARTPGASEPLPLRGPPEMAHGDAARGTAATPAAPNSANQTR
jgi:tetratricopeptide (TPR) repeat protein